MHVNYVGGEFDHLVNKFAIQKQGCWLICNYAVSIV